MTAFNVDDRKPPARQADRGNAVAHERPLVVGTTMRERAAHRVERVRLDRPSVEMADAGDTTHCGSRALAGRRERR